MFGTKSCASALAIVALLLTAGLASAEDINNERELDTEIMTGTTLKLGGGDWIGIQSGDILFAVIYGTDENPNEIILLTTQKRFLGGADVYTTGNDFLRMRGIPINLLFYQKLISMIEFTDSDGNGLFDLRWIDNGMNMSHDMPVKLASLEQAWEMSQLSIHNSQTEATVDFELTAENVPYKWTWSGTGMHMPWAGDSGDGVVEEITFSFHLRLAIENETIQMIPWYRVEIQNGQVENSEFLEYRNYSSNAINGTIKYDHYIRGWDFTSNESRLAVETHIIAGLHAGNRVSQWLRERVVNMECVTNGSAVMNERGHGPDSPIISRDRLRFNDNWERVGRVSWISDVEVDNSTEQMMFQIQFGGELNLSYGGHHFRGFMVRAAYLYPAGDEIFHDPLFESTASTLEISDVANAFPELMNLLQLAAVVFAAAIAVALSIYLNRRNGRRNQRQTGGGSQDRDEHLFPGRHSPPQPPVDSGRKEE